jgi:hypothetical protein
MARLIGGVAMQVYLEWAVQKSKQRDARLVDE